MARRNTTLGIFFMLVFCAFAPVMDASAKATPVEVPVTQAGVHAACSSTHNITAAVRTISHPVTPNT